MSHIYLPPSALDRRQEFTSEIVQMVETHKVLDRWNAELRELDPYLQMVRVKEDARPLPGLKPGYYALVRHNPGAPPSVIPVEGEHGEFVEPTSRLFEKLKEHDMWGDNTPQKIRKRQEKLEAAKQRAEEREREERQEEFRDRLKARISPGVSMTGQGKGWSYRAGARRAK